MTTITSKSGKQIILRPLQEDDLDAIYQYAQAIEKENTYITLHSGEPITYKEEQEYIQSVIKKISKGNLVQLLAFDQDKVIGNTQVEKKGKRQKHIGSFGIAMLKEYRGQGLGTQMMQIIEQQAQEKLGVTKIILTCFAINQPAINLYQKMGYQQFGRLPEGIKYQGELIDQLYMHKDIVPQSTEAHNTQPAAA